jgi:hypothetical protein
MINNFSKLALQANGRIQPLTFNSKESGHTGLTNPSVLYADGKLFTNIRNVQYALYHSEFQQHFQNQWGCLAYLNPEDDITLRTKNFLSLDGGNFKAVDTSKLDKKPLWEFIGLEDARLVKWDGKLYLCGVRRDTTTNGEGRMELSEIVDGKEVNRYRIEPPNGHTYCEKNWMPILDMPFHFVKWSNPTEVVKVDINTLTSETIVHKEQSVSFPRDIRGGSQVVPYKDFYIAVTHEVDLWMNQKNNKDAHYYHRIIVWDKQWNIIQYTDEFKFLGANIEFCCGLAHKDDEFIMTFGFQDTTAFMLSMPTSFLEDFIDGKHSQYENFEIKVPKIFKKLYEFVSNIDMPKSNFDIAKEFFDAGHFASSLSFFLRCAELNQLKPLHYQDTTEIYNALIYVALSLGNMGRRRASQKTAILNAIAYDCDRWEGYYLLSQWFEVEQDYVSCYTNAIIANALYNDHYINHFDIHRYQIEFQIAFSAWWVGKFKASRDGFFKLANTYGMEMSDTYRELVQNNITRLGSGDRFLSYTKEKHDSLIHKFEGSETIERNYSQTYQDLFVLLISNGKKEGLYLEIGSADPVYGSNTKLLESEFGWKGVGIEILQEEVDKHDSQRTNPVMCKNALEVDYNKLLDTMTKGDSQVFIDYLQVDCEPPKVSFEILQMIPWDKYKFGVVTFEHDYYADLSKSIREASRRFMRSKGYILAVGNVSMNDDCPYEDWWVHPEYIKANRLMNIVKVDSEVVNMEKFMFDNK